LHGDGGVVWYRGGLDVMVVESRRGIASNNNVFSAQSKQERKTIMAILRKKRYRLTKGSI
jgi:hypothetical protein